MNRVEYYVQENKKMITERRSHSHDSWSFLVSGDYLYKSLEIESRSLPYSNQNMISWNYCKLINYSLLKVTNQKSFKLTLNKNEPNWIG